MLYIFKERVEIIGSALQEENHKREKENGDCTRLELITVIIGCNLVATHSITWPIE